MYRRNCLLFLVATIIGANVVEALPLIKRAVAPGSVTPGTVMRAAPVNFMRHHPGNSVGSGGTPHPVIAIGHPDPHGHVPVISVTHSQPPHMSDHVRPADQFTTHTDKKFQPGSQLAVGNPVAVHVDDLHHVSPHNPIPNQLHPSDTRSLVHAVNHPDRLAHHAIAQQAAAVGRAVRANPTPGNQKVRRAARAHDLSHSASNYVHYHPEDAHHPSVPGPHRYGI